MSFMADIIDPTSNALDYSEETGLEVLQTILPYFPDDERMANYLCYVASGWTRKSALIRAGASILDLEEWRKDAEFLKLDTIGYNELRKQVADAYAERLVRKNTVQALEFDGQFFETVQEKLVMGMELSKDERAFALKRTSLYGPETLGQMRKLLDPSFNPDEDGSVKVFDMVAFVRSRRMIG